jgi:hypothetical protein
VEPVRSKINKAFVSPRFSFAIDSYASVSVMVNKIVAEPPSANLKAQVTTAKRSDGRTRE